MDSESAALLSEILTRLQRLEDRWGAALPLLSAEAVAAGRARAEAKARGFHTVATFAAAVGRSPHWVSDRCRLKSIRTLPGGKPYRIPLAEEARFLGLTSS